MADGAKLHPQPRIGFTCPATLATGSKFQPKDRSWYQKVYADDAWKVWYHDGREGVDSQRRKARW